MSFSGVPSLDADVIVVGAGPAGSAVAVRLAHAGIDVLVIDREHFPRDKACGDFLSPPALEELDALGIDRGGRDGRPSWNKVSSALVVADGLPLVSQHFPPRNGSASHGCVVPRHELDAVLLDRARQAGARVMPGAHVRGFERGAGRIDVHVQRGPARRRLRARLLVGADGSRSVIARALRGVHPKADLVIAMRAYYEGTTGPSDRCDLVFSQASFPGYCWLFPTGEHTANVGIGIVAETLPPTETHLRRLLTDFVESDPFLRARLGNARLVGRIVGWPLNTYNASLALVDERVLLVGDAAGLINPLNGEGIQYALTSARWASETAIAALGADDLSRDRLAAYAHRIHRELDRDMAVSRAIVKLIANRALNPLWLSALRGLCRRAGAEQWYSAFVGGVLLGQLPVRWLLWPDVLAESTFAITREMLQSAGRAMIRALVVRDRATAAAIASNVKSIANLRTHPLETIAWGESVLAELHALALLRNAARWPPL